MDFLKTLNPLFRRNLTSIPNPKPLPSLHTLLSPSLTAASPVPTQPHVLIHSWDRFSSPRPHGCSRSPPRRSPPRPLLSARSSTGTNVIPSGGVHTVVDTVQWEPRQISGGDAGDAVAGGGERFLNLPNLVSIGRMVSGPVIGWMILNEWYLPAFGSLALSGASDWLDEFLARKMGINSVIGSYQDLLANKVLISCVVVAMVEKELLHPGLVGLVVVRDLLLVGGAFYKRAASLEKKWNSWSDFVNLDSIQRDNVEPLFISKVNTIFQLILVAGAILQPEFGTEETQNYITYLSWLVDTTIMASTVGYGVKYYQIRPRT